MKKSFFRIMALFLVLILILNFSPIRVSAFALPEAAGVTAHIIPFAQVVEPAALGLGGTVFAWVLFGIGVVCTTVQMVDLYNDFQEYSGLMDVSVYYYPDGTWSYGVDLNFVERVHAWLFDTEIVSIAGEFLSEGTKTTLYDGKEFYVRRGPYNYRRGIYMDSDSSKLRNFELAWWYYEVSGAEYVRNGSVSNGQITYVGDFQIRYYINTVYSDSFAAPYFGEFSSDGTKTAEKVLVEYIVRQGEIVDFVAPDGVELGEIARPGTISTPDGWAGSPYADWYANSRPAINPDTKEEITVLPIPFNPSADPGTAPDTLTQPDIWQGSIADPMPGTGTVPDGSIAETPWDAVKKWVSDFFIPSGDITMYSLDLTELFPFCIPFDLFDLLSALRADPVAPVFELELDFGITKAPIVVDLSGWSDLASIVRILEVGLFCIGLALGTKELIG